MRRNVFLFALALGIAALPLCSLSQVVLRAPQQLHFFARDTQSNASNDSCLLDMTAIAFDSIVLSIHRDGLPHLNVKKVPTDLVSGRLNLSYTLQAGLYRYTISLSSFLAGTSSQFYFADSILCGDALLVNGQSNAESYIPGDTTSISTNFIRTYGSNYAHAGAVLSDSSWHVPNQGRESFGIGIWPMKLARVLVDSLQIPICIMQGARRGAQIAYFLRDSTHPGDMNTNYGRMLYRLQKSGLSQSIRLFIWSQGENVSTGIDNYDELFLSLWHGLKNDCPAMQKAYIIQTRRNECNIGSLNYPFIPDLQRRLSDRRADIELISTTDIPQNTDYCHFLASGYLEIARRLSIEICALEYAKPSFQRATTSQIDTAYFLPTDSTILVVQTTNPADLLNIPVNHSLEGWTIECSEVQVTSLSVVNNRMMLQLSGHPKTACGLSYMGAEHSFVHLRMPVTNQNNIGLPSFYNLQIGNYNSDRSSVNHEGPAGLRSFLQSHKSSLEAYFSVDTGLVSTNGNMKPLSGDSIALWKDVRTGRGYSLLQPSAQHSPVIDGSGAVDANNRKWMYNVPNPKLQVGHHAQTGVLIMELGNNNPYYILGQGNASVYRGLGLNFWSTQPRINAAIKAKAGTNTTSLQINSPNGTDRHAKLVVIYSYHPGQRRLTINMNGSYISGIVPGNTSIYNPYNFILGGMGSGTGTQAKFYEMVFYSEALNSAEQRILSNYYSTLYGIRLFRGDVDHFDEQLSSYTEDQTGIGRLNNNSEVHVCDDVASAELRLKDSSFLLNDNDFLMMANNGLTGTFDNTVDSMLGAFISPSTHVAYGLNKEWYFSLSDSGANGGRVALSFKVPAYLMSLNTNTTRAILIYSDSLGLHSIDTGVFLHSASLAVFDANVNDLKDRHISYLLVNNNAPLELESLVLWLSDRSDNLVFNWADDHFDVNFNYFLEQRRMGTYPGQEWEGRLLSLLEKGEQVSIAPLTGETTFYRLSKQDLSGHRIVSNAVTVEGMPSGFRLLNNSISCYEPLLIESLAADQGNLITHVSVFNVLGKEVFRDQRYFVKGMNEIIADPLSPGQYFIRLLKGNKTFSRTFFVQ